MWGGAIGRQPMRIKKSIRLALALTLATVTAIPTAIIPTAAFAATGYPVMMRGIEGANPQEAFADLIVESVKKDPTGSAELRGGVGGYSPRHVYAMMREYHPELGFTKLNPTRTDFIALADYIRTLELKKLEKGGVYRNSRMIRRGNTYRHDLRWQHFLPAGTEVLVDRNTGVPILKRNCANGVAPVVVARPSPCIYVLVPAHTDLKLSQGVLSPVYRDTQRCEFSIAGPGIGANGQMFTPEDFVKVTEREPFPCDWTKSVQYFGQPVALQGCMRVTKGWWAIKLDPSFLDDYRNILDLCEQLPDGTTSLSVDIRPRDFVRNANGIYMAVVWPSEAEVPTAYPEGQWFEWNQTRFPELEARYSFRRN